VKAAEIVVRRLACIRGCLFVQHTFLLQVTITGKSAKQCASALYIGSTIHAPLRECCIAAYSCTG
jgi:hypothetical protein